MTFFVCYQKHRVWSDVKHKEKKVESINNYVWDGAGASTPQVRGNLLEKNTPKVMYEDILRLSQMITEKLKTVSQMLWK